MFRVGKAGRRALWLLPLLLAAGLATGPLLRVDAATISSATMSGGDHQTGTVGSTLPNPLSMTVMDSDNHPVAGVNVHFDFGSVPSGASGQSLSAKDVATDANGQASTRLTLGNTPGTYNVTAQASQLPNDQTRTFTENAVASNNSLAMSSGSGQSASANATLASPLAVTVTDNGNAVSGATVTWSIISAPSGATGQHLSTSTTTTDSGGNSFNSFTLGNLIGEYDIQAAVSGASGSPQTFIARATSSAANIATISGSGQSGAASTTLSNPFVVRLTDSNGNPLSGQPVNFNIISQPSGSSGTTLSNFSATTDSNGQASTFLTLGNMPGT